MVHSVRPLADWAFDLTIGTERQVAPPTGLTRVLVAERFAARTTDRSVIATDPPSADRTL